MYRIHRPTWRLLQRRPRCARSAAHEPSARSPLMLIRPDSWAWVQRNGGRVDGCDDRCPTAATGLRSGCHRGVCTATRPDGVCRVSLTDAAQCRRRTPAAALIELPSTCQLTLDESTDPRVAALVERVPAELWGGRLALQLLAHRVLGDASPFATYVDALPVGVPGASDILQRRCY